MRSGAMSVHRCILSTQIGARHAVGAQYKNAEQMHRVCSLQQGFSNFKVREDVLGNLLTACRAPGSLGWGGQASAAGQEAVCWEILPQGPWASEPTAWQDWG